MDVVHGIKVDYSRDSLFDELGKLRLRESYMKEEEEELKTIMSLWQSLMLQVPNVPDMSVPEGDSDADNQEVRRWGEPTVFSLPYHFRISHKAYMNHHSDQNHNLLGRLNHFYKDYS